MARAARPRANRVPFFEHGIGTDRALLAYDRVRADRVAHHRARSDLAVDEMDRRPDNSSACHRRTAFEDDAGEQGDLSLEAHGGIEIGARRVPHGYAPAHPARVDTCPQVRLGLGELGPLVHLERFDRVREPPRC